MNPFKKKLRYAKAEAIQKTIDSIIKGKKVNYWACDHCAKIFKQFWLDDDVWFSLPKKWWFTTLCRNCFKKLKRKISKRQVIEELRQFDEENE